MKVAVIIVSHKSTPYLEVLLPTLYHQTTPFSEVVIVETNPNHSLSPLRERFPFTYLEPKENLGFCKGNNLGLKALKERPDWVLFCNPDIVLPVWFLEKALASIQEIDQKEKGKLGAFSTLLLGFDFEKKEATGLIDSAGIASTFYGKFFDRFQGKKLGEIIFKQEKVEALCGALFFIKNSALESVLLEKGDLFNPDFFMYKEDIDLSLRLKKENWLLYVDLFLHAFHGRGWQGDSFKKRKNISKEFRLISARNECYIHLREKNFMGILFSHLKYLLVKVCDI